MKFLTYVALITILVSCSKENILVKDNKNQESISYILNDDTTIVVHPFLCGDSLMAFVPSYWDTTQVKVSIGGGTFKCIDNMGGVILAKSKLPTIYIRTESGSMEYVNERKSNEESGTICVIDTTGNIEYSGELESIHGRGNYTWWQEKKPYSIKLSHKADILGLKRAKKFNMLSQPDDYTGLRNWICYTAAKRLGVPFAIDFNFANVYFNGNYAGCYLITNKVDIGKSGVNIHDLEKETKKKNEKPLEEYPKIVQELDGKIIKAWDIPNNPSDITGGYLLEYDSRPEVLKTTPSVFQPKHGGNMMLKSPQYASMEQMEYIRNLWDDVENVLIDYSRGENEEKLDSLLDVPSFVKNYLCQEVFMNMDAGSMSFFLYKDRDQSSNSKIVAAPIWDFDSSLHNSKTGLLGQELCKTIYAGAGVFPTVTGFNGILGMLYKNRGFRQQVTNMYAEKMKPIVEELMWGNTWDSISSYIQYDMTVDNLRWRNNNKFIIETNLMKVWMRNRLEYLNYVWMENPTKISHNVYIEIAYNGFNHLLLYPVQKGELLNVEFPVFQKKVETKEGYVYEFAGWSINGKPVSLDTLHVNNDMHIKAEWNTTKTPGPVQMLKNWWHAYKNEKDL